MKFFICNCIVKVGYGKIIENLVENEGDKMDELRKILEGKVLSEIDLRKIDLRYLCLKENEQKEWENRNILYNTIWFYVKKALEKEVPEMEKSKFVYNVFNKLPPFNNNQKWICKYKKEGKKESFYCTPKYYDSSSADFQKDYKPFTADLMTGWWVPFKYLTGLSSRESLSIVLLKKLPSENNEDELKKWFETINPNLKGKDGEDPVKAFLDFLKVVYTVGNTIPAPENPAPGRGLDTWQYKLHGRIMGQESDEWETYISECFENDWPKFVEKNFLKMYFEVSDKQYKNPISFWYGRAFQEGDSLELNSAKNAKVKDWENYLKNATNCIVKRNEEIQTALSKDKQIK